MQTKSLIKPVAVALREDVAYQSYGQLHVDRENNTVRGLLLSGLQSKNNRTYLIEAYQDALPLYEGARCNIDHPTPGEKEVPFARRFGVYRNVHLTPEGPRADLVYNPAHPMAPAFIWWAENCPEAVGLSHNADGEGQMNADGSVTVTKLHKIHSVDLVADPATSPRGLAEAQTMAVDPSNNQAYQNPFQPQQQKPGAAGMPMGDTKLKEDEPDGDEGGDTWQSQLADAMRSLMLDDTKSPEDKWAAIEQMFSAVHPSPKPSEADDAVPHEETKSAGNDEECKMYEGEDEDDDEGMDKKTMESVRRLASKDKSVRRLLESWDKKRTRERLAKRRVEVVKMCESSNLNKRAITDVFIESLIHSDNKTAQKLIEDRRNLFLESTRVKPTSAAPGPMKNDDFNSFLAGLKTSK
jgi:hypothetical protein